MPLPATAGHHGKGCNLQSRTAGSKQVLWSTATMAGESTIIDKIVPRGGIAWRYQR